MKLSGKHIVGVTAFLALISLSMVGAQSNPPTDADCVDAEPFPNPDDCTSYYQCFNIPTGWVVVNLTCPTGGYYDVDNKVCVEGTCENPTTVPPTTEDPTTVEPTTAPADESTPAATAEASETTSASSDSGSSTDLTSDTSTEATTEVSTEASTEATTEVSTEATTEVSTEATTEASTEASTEESTTEPTTASSDEPTTQVSVAPPTFECTATGFFAHPTDPTKYFQCVLIGAQFYYYVYNCAPNACYQASQGVCVIGTCPTANSTTTTTPAPTGSTMAPINITCNTQGSYPYPQSCTKYYNCILIAGSLVYYVFECPPGSHYDPSTSLCAKGPCPSSSTTAVSSVTEITTELALTSPGPTAPPCPTEGYFPSTSDCHSYYMCIKIQGAMYYYFYHCPVGTYWNAGLKGCMVGDCPASGTSIAPSESPVGSTSPVPFSCSQEGIFTDPSGCSSYNRCIQIFGVLYYFTYTCPPLTHFDLSKGLCVIGSC